MRVTDPSVADEPLRERKRKESRAEFVRVAERLFVSQGYEATTVEQICDEANRSVPTFYAYFNSKEEVALTAGADNVKRLRDLIENPERETDTTTLWRAFVEEAALFAMNSPQKLEMLHLIESEPALVRIGLSLLQQQESILAAGLAADRGTDPAQDLSVQLLATLLSFGNYTVYRHWLLNGASGDLLSDTRAVVDLACERFSDVVSSKPRT